MHFLIDSFSNVFTSYYSRKFYTLRGRAYNLQLKKIGSGQGEVAFYARVKHIQIFHRSAGYIIITIGDIKHFSAFIINLFVVVSSVGVHLKMCFLVNMSPLVLK